MVEDEAVIRDVSRRNRNLLVSSRRGPCYFVKFGTAEAAPGRVREADRYRSLAAVPAMKDFMPAFVREDPARGMLVLSGSPAALDLWAYHRNEARFPVAVAGEVGRALGVLHRETRLCAPRAAPASAPWILSIHRPSTGTLAEHSPTSLELIKLVQWHAGFGRRFDELREAWQAESLVHGDVKWSNILISPAHRGSKPRVTLVDWEHAGER